MHLNKASVRLVVLAISIPLVVLGTIVSVVGQAPPNLPPPGAYVPIPNYSGVGAGLLFRGAINDRFSGAQRMAPAIATASFANLPIEQDGMLIYCPDCKLTSPCTGTGTGAWALGARSQWTCSSGALEANLNANGNKIANLANGTVGGDTLVFGQPAGSDLSGSFPNPIVQTVLGGKVPVYSNQLNPLLKDSMLPVLGAATNVFVQGSANFTLNKPSTVVSGHTMIVGYFSNDTAAPTPPSGWTLIRSDTGCGIFGTMGSYYKVAGSSEPSTYTWLINGGNNYHSAALIDVGVTAANPVDAISPAVCASGPTLAGLTLGAQPERVLLFGGGSNNFLGSATQILFNQGTQFAQITGSGVVPFSGAHLTANYATSPSVTMTIGGGAAQMIAIKPAASYGSSPVLQGDSYAELTNLVPTASSVNASIKGFNIDGRFNVKNPTYGAKGDSLTDDTAAIQGAYNAACAEAVTVTHGETLWFPAGTYITSFPLISNCSQPITWKCESEGACTIQAVSEGIFPIIMHEGNGYVNGITAQGPILASSLATGSGSSLNWGANSQQYYDLKDAVFAINPTGWGNAKPINGQSALSIEGFLNYAGGGSGSVYILDSDGDDLNLPNGSSSAIQLYLLAGTPNKLAACITTTGSGFVCSGAGGSITASTTYEFEASYDGSMLRIFEGIPGSTTTLAASVAATGTIVQKPSEVFALGDGGGLTIGGTNFASAHWIGQLDSIRISNTARHTTTYTAPTAKFASDGNTSILLNNLAQNDSLLRVTNVTGIPAPVWIPLHYYGPFGSGATPGNVHASFVNLTLQGGSYNLLGENVLYTTLDHVTGIAASHDSFKFEYIAYGTRVEHLTANSFPYAECNVAFVHTNGEINLSWLDSIGSYYGMELIDANGVYSMLFMNPSNTSIADLDIGGSGDPFNSTSIHELNVDFESGGTPIPAKIWGNGAIQFYGGNYQYDPSVNAIWVGLNAANEGLALSLFGGQVAILGTPVNPLISWKGTGSPATPAIWINPMVNSKALSAIGVPLSDNSDYVQGLGDVLIPPVKTVSTLPTCNSAAKGWVVQIKDCNANCTTYLGTSFTGGGSTRSTVQCNGTAWELH